jgi:hypothetical protein
VSPDELLTRFKPQLRYDSQEAFFADSAEEMTANPGNQLRRPDGDVLAEGDALTLELLGYPNYANGEDAEADDVLGQDLRNRIYGHAATDSGGRLWLQYWFWYFYNDYHLAADFGLHEGDWEMVQLRMQGDEPDIALYAQHAYAEMRAWSDVRKTDDGRPVVYPGRGSHASYFEPGLYETEGWYDIADGKRPAPELELEIVSDEGPSWVLWPGFWGDTKAHFLLDEDSPRGPSQHDQWGNPATLLGKAVTRPPQMPPIAPEVSVRREHGMLRIDFDFSGRPGPGEPVKLIATVNSEDEHGVPPKTFTFDIGGVERGHFATRFALNPEHRYDVYTSVTSRVNGKEVPSASHCTPIAPGVASKIPDWLKRPLWWLVRRLNPR